jgi:hypothetical protein
MSGRHTDEQHKECGFPWARSEEKGPVLFYESPVENGREFLKYVRNEISLRRSKVREDLYTFS